MFPAEPYACGDRKEGEPTKRAEGSRGFGEVAETAGGGDE